MTEQKQPKKQDATRAAELDESQLDQSSGGAEPANVIQKRPPLRLDPVNG